MKIYVLTVGNEQRLAHIAKQLQDVEYELIYSESEEQLKEYNQTYAQRQLRFTTRTLGLGEMGAWRIHVRAWEKVAQNECPCLLIEDNALIHSNLVERLPQILEDTQNYGMISFAEHPRRSAETSPSTTANVERAGGSPCPSFGWEYDSGCRLRSSNWPFRFSGS